MSETRLAFFDLDRTLYDGWSTVDFLHLMVDRNWANMNLEEENKNIQNSYTGTYESYKEVGLKVIELGIKQLNGYSRQQVLEMEDEFIKISWKLYAYSQPLIKLLNRAGFISYIVSGAIFPPVEAIGRELNMPFFASTAMEKNHIYTGKLKLHLDGEVKRKKINEVIKNAARPVFSLGFGDSSGDIPLLEATSRAFVVNPHQAELVKVAKAKGYQLVTPDTILAEVARVVASR
jgi:HAD superfamily phosphoserine phosphatase-like hydrolase